MSLVKCPECNNDISNEAKICPHCGYKNEAKIYENSSLGVLSLGIEIIAFIVFAIGLMGAFLLSFVGLVLAILDIFVNIRNKHSCSIIAIILFAIKILIINM